MNKHLRAQRDVERHHLRSYSILDERQVSLCMAIVFPEEIVGSHRDVNCGLCKGIIHVVMSTEPGQWRTAFYRAYRPDAAAADRDDIAVTRSRTYDRFTIIDRENKKVNLSTAQARDVARVITETLEAEDKSPLCICGGDRRRIVEGSGPQHAPGCPAGYAREEP